MKTLLHSCIVFCFLAVATGQPVLRLKVHQDGSSRRQISAERISPDSQRHMILQFNGAPSGDTVPSLKSRGITVLQDVPDNAVLVLMNQTAQLDDLDVRYAAPLDPVEKISPLITTADRSTQREYFLVEFHPDVEPYAARRLLLSSKVEMLENPDLARNQFLIHAPSRVRTQV